MKLPVQFYLWLIVFVVFPFLLVFITESLRKLLDRLYFIRILKKTDSNIVKSKGKPIIYIDNMTGDKFEIFLKEMFKSLGYKVKKTPYSGDFGTDLIIKKDDKEYIVQAKRYKKNVGLKAVQEIVASKAHYKIYNPILITNSYLTKGAKELAKDNNVIVYERPELIELVRKSKQAIKNNA